MFLNYLKIAWRNTLRNKTYALINISGLAVGLTASVFLLWYLYQEYQFDMFHEHSDRIYRVVNTIENPDGEDELSAQTPGPVGPALVNDLPGIKQQTRVLDLFRMTVQKNNIKYYEGEYLFTEPSFFQVFDFILVEGNSETALSEPNSVVLTESAAVKYFGDEPAMNQTLQIEGLGNVRVTGILQDPPENSHLMFNMLFPFASLETATDWWNDFAADWNPGTRLFSTYILLEREVNRSNIEDQLSVLYQQHLSGKESSIRHFEMQNIRDIHFNSGMIQQERNHREGNVIHIYIFALLALLILVLAALNYINLATAQAARRFREVGVRKVMGASRSQLLWQFLAEAVFITSIAFLLSLALVHFLAPHLENIFGFQYSVNMGGAALFLFGMAGIAIAVGLSAGMYPAFFLSQLQPVAILKDKLRFSRRSILRNGLIVLQFSISCLVIISTLVISKQLQFFQEKNLGYQPENVISIDINSGNVRQNFLTMRSELANVSGVTHVSVSSRLPGDWKPVPQVAAEMSGRSGEAVTTYYIESDAKFLELYNIDLLKGQNFTSGSVSDSSAVLLNETAADHFGESEILGKFISIPYNNGQSVFRAKVIGVVKDFHFQSLHSEIEPLILAHYKSPLDVIDYFAVRFSGGDVTQLLESLQVVHEQFDQLTPFEYNFLDSRLETFYRTERQMNKIFTVASFLAMFIAGLGLFGLSAYMAARRVKEISIRKVLGATEAGIVSFMSIDFLKVTAIGFLISIPMAYLAMENWLQQFAYQVRIGPQIFLITGGILLFVVFTTVSSQSIKAARVNPTEALRNE